MLELAFSWLLSRPPVTSVIAGATPVPSRCRAKRQSRAVAWLLTALKRNWRRIRPRITAQADATEAFAAPGRVSFNRCDGVGTQLPFSRHTWRQCRRDGNSRWPAVRPAKGMSASDILEFQNSVHQTFAPGKCLVGQKACPISCSRTPASLGVRRGIDWFDFLAHEDDGVDRNLPTHQANPTRG